MRPLKAFEYPRHRIVQLWMSRIKPLFMNCYQMLCGGICFKYVIPSVYNYNLIYVFVLFLNTYPDGGFLKSCLLLRRIINLSNFCFVLSLFLYVLKKKKIDFHSRINFLKKYRISHSKVFLWILNLNDCFVFYYITFLCCKV